MYKFARDFWTSKTTHLTIGVILASVGAALQGQIDWKHAAVAIVAALYTAFIRDTHAKQGDKVLGTLLAVAQNAVGQNTADGGEVSP